MSDKIKVMLSTEGTYPFHHGGVSTWCHIFAHNLSQVEYVFYSIIMNPFIAQKFTIPAESQLIKVPLWGTEEPSEHLTTPFSQVYIAKHRTDNKIIQEHFLPLFHILIEEIINPQKNPFRLGNTLLEMYKYFQEYDYKKTFKSEVVWDYYKKMVLEFIRDKKEGFAEPNVFSLSQSLGWIYRFLIILNTPLPKVDVSHSAAAAFCGIPCVLAKLESRVPFLLTEHGIYLREQYLSLSNRGYSPYLATFFTRLIHTISGLNYAFADQVSPVCQYNSRWEKIFGVSPKAIKVIYNGVDKDVFSPRTRISANKYPTVVTVARIDPVKDLLTLIRAAALVRDRIPHVKFIIYGSVTVPEYYQQCVALQQELGLEDTVIFGGHTDDMAKAYNSGDVIALSSITEAFPYSVVEAMMTGKPVVATDVGGIREALGECGLLIRPRQPEQLAEKLLILLENPELCAKLGEEARQRALNYFTIEKVVQEYLSSYVRLALGKKEENIVSLSLKKQKLFAEKGYALISMGYWEEAVLQFRRAINEETQSSAVPVLLAEIASAYNNQGYFDKAFAELEKIEAWATIVGNKEIA